MGPDLPVQLPPALRSGVARHPYASLFGFALTVRVALAVFIAELFPQLSFFDDGTYSQLAREKLTDVSDTWDSYTAWLYVHTGTLEYPLTLLYRIFGPAPLVGALLVTVFGAAVSALVARLAAHVVDLRLAIAAGIFVALMPSQVLVSSVLAKDAMTWSLLAGLALVVATAANAVSARRVVALSVVAAVLLALIGLLRLHTMTVAAFALVLAAGFGLRATRAPRLIGFGLAAVAVPWVLGIGPVGLQLVAHHGSLEGTRAYHASGGSAVPGVKPKPAVSPTSSARPTAVATGSESQEADGVARSLTYLPRGVSVVLVEPLPWRTTGSKAFRLAAAEQLIWYPLLLLGIVGACFSWRRRDVLAFPVLTAAALVCMWALVDGNIGTAFRHRGEVVWAVVVLAAYGLQVLRDRRRNRLVAEAEQGVDFDTAEVQRPQPVGPS
jgi:hypothetical protein